MMNYVFTTSFNAWGSILDDRLDELIKDVADLLALKGGYEDFPMIYDKKADYRVDPVKTVILVGWLMRRKIIRWKYRINRFGRRRIY